MPKVKNLIALHNNSVKIEIKLNETNMTSESVKNIMGALNSQNLNDLNLDFGISGAIKPEAADFISNGLMKV